MLAVLHLIVLAERIPESLVLSNQPGHLTTWLHGMHNRCSLDHRLPFALSHTCHDPWGLFIVGALAVGRFRLNSQRLDIVPALATPFALLGLILLGLGVPFIKCFLSRAFVSGWQFAIVLLLDGQEFCAIFSFMTIDTTVITSSSENEFALRTAEEGVPIAPNIIVPGTLWRFYR